MSELDSHLLSLSVDEIDDLLHGGDFLVFPETDVFGGVAALWGLVGGRRWGGEGIRRRGRRWPQ